MKNPTQNPNQNQNPTQNPNQNPNLLLPLIKANALGVWFEDAAELEGKLIGDGKKVEMKNLDEWKRGLVLLLIIDKVSAFSVLVGDNPVANLRSLDALLGMVTSKVGKSHALSGFEALQELFIASLLPDRKLKTLMQRPLNHIPENKDVYSLLLFWYWEECLKQRYERFIVALEEASRDMLPALKNKSLKAVVVNEVDTFLFRPHLSPRSQYHAVNFLSQIRLTNKGDGPKVAKRFIDVYFGLFKVLITGPSSNEKFDKRVNRAFPFVSSNEADDIIDVQTPALFQLNLEEASSLLLACFVVPLSPADYRPNAELLK
ncbi:hypothetical protein TSUD_49170 [Trifolium subterraneum]|uniref:Uncharacterized protein n=1 Tax=Trifolium subterraneum TaxID=3900 RepID=A0A2Z6M0T3_TRISU|nr:hypothetical protein TSUD_49170 [Trifolium subterraneum]